VRQARWRNRSAVRAGRVELRLATAAALPYDAGHFTKVCAVNSLQFWPSVEAGLREVHRVLAPGGRVVMALRMRVENTNQFDRRRFGATDARIAEIVAAVERVGFRDVATQRRDVRGELHTAIGASR
jgi:SAM-dependent methyltransferase